MLGMNILHATGPVNENKNNLHGAKAHVPHTGSLYLVVFANSGMGLVTIPCNSVLLHISTLNLQNPRPHSGMQK